MRGCQFGLDFCSRGLGGCCPKQVRYRRGGIANLSEIEERAQQQACVPDVAELLGKVEFRSPRSEASLAPPFDQQDRKCALKRKFAARSPCPWSAR
jgi:hypothetical protein